jgi:hypothetical protein
MGLAVHDPRIVHFHHNTLVNVGTSSEIGIRVSGVSTDTVIVENNIIDFTGATTSSDLLSCEYGAHPLIVRNNLFINGRTAMFWNYTHGTIENNTIIGGGTQSFPWPLDVELDYFQRLTIRNNVFYQTRTLPRFTVCSSCGPGARIDYIYNAFWPPVDSFYFTELPAGYLTINDSANFNAYPMFADDSVYRLEAGSPMIDAGDPAVNDSDGSRSDVGWTGGASGVTYEYPELAPSPPESLWVNGAGNLVSIVWSARPEADLAQYLLYRGTTSGFWMPGIPSLRTLGPSDTTAIDTLLNAGESYFYVVTAEDSFGLESGASPEASFVLSGIFDDPGAVAIPRTPHVARVYPNPFNAATTVEVFIPKVGAMPAPVRITLYDVTGREVSIPFDGRLGAGLNSIEVAARDHAGRTLASGVYFARLRMWNTEFDATTKLIHLK